METIHLGESRTLPTQLVLHVLDSPLRRERARDGV